MPKSAVPSSTAPKETAGFTLTARALILGSMVRFSICW